MKHLTIPGGPFHKGVCQHYRGKWKCNIGVDMKQHTPDADSDMSKFRVPCIRWNELVDMALFGEPRAMSDAVKAEISRQGTCPSYEEPTEEQLALWKRQKDDLVAMFSKPNQT